SFEDLDVIEHLAARLRGQLATAKPSFIRSVAPIIFALERLPRPTVGLQVRFGYQTPRCDGNYAWADILLSEHYIEGTVGEHFYDPDVGGDTESSVLFYREIGGSSDYGSMKEWLARFDDVSEYGQWTIE